AGILAPLVTGVQTCALPISPRQPARQPARDGRPATGGMDGAAPAAESPREPAPAKAEPAERPKPAAPRFTTAQLPEGKKIKTTRSEERRVGKEGRCSGERNR